MVAEMISFILIQIYLLIGILFSAGHDATTYRLKAPDNAFSGRRINRWHRDGLVLAISFVIPVTIDLHAIKLFPDWYWCIVAAAFLRLAFFDMAFNKWAGMITPFFLGGTAKADRFFIKIFGKHGAGWKCLTFFILLIALNFLKFHFNL